jgi:hypothetical protein
MKGLNPIYGGRCDLSRARYCSGGSWGGVEGVRLHMEYLRAMLRKALIMTDCHPLAAISSSIFQ